MKKLFIVALAGFIYTSSFSQIIPVHLGLKVGPNITKIQGQEFKDGFNVTYHVGAFASIDLKGKWQLQPELLFNQTQARTTTSSELTAKNLRPDIKAKLNYLSIPVLVNYRPIRLLTLQAGPEFSVLLNQDKNLLQNSGEAFKSGNVSAVVGAQLNILKYKVYGRYNIGVANISDVSNSAKWTSQTIQLGVGYTIF